MDQRLRAARHRRDRVPEGCPLTPSEFGIIRALAEGLTYKQIARQRGVTLSTVVTHANNAYKRLGVSGYPAMALVMRSGWLGWQPAPPQDPDLGPFLRAYLVELDAWLASGGRDRRARQGMRLALAGARNLNRRETP